VARTASLGALRLQAPRVRVERAEDGGWSFARWAAGAGASSAASQTTSTSTAISTSIAKPASPASAGPAAAAASPPWRIALGELAIDQGQLGFRDRRLAVPAALDLADIAAEVKGFALDAAAPAPFQLRMKVAVPAGPSGRAVGAGVVGSVDARGELKGIGAGVPQAANVALVLKDLPLHLR